MQIVPTKKFKSDVKFYIKKKKYLQLDKDIKSVTDELLKGNLIGDKLEDIELETGTAVYKVRIKNSSANVGKSDGFRLIYYVVVDEKIYLLSIYSKKDDNRILTDKQISIIIKNVIEYENEIL